jgi:ribose transport system permease protein
MGAVILAGVLADQQFNRYRQKRRASQAMDTLARESTAPA